MQRTTFHDLVLSVATIYSRPLRYGRHREQIADDIDAGLADIAPLGRFALANPDIVERLRADAPLNELDPATLYGRGAAGYTDYPALAHA